MFPSVKRSYEKKWMGSGEEAEYPYNHCHVTLCLSICLTKIPFNVQLTSCSFLSLSAISTVIASTEMIKKLPCQEYLIQG